MTVMRAVPCVIVGAVLIGVASSQCGELLNSQRAFSTAPVVQPVWRADIATDVRPVVYDDVAVIVGTGKGDTMQRVFALRATTGEQLWRTDFEAESVERVVGDFVHVSGRDGVARAVRLRTGEEGSRRSGPARFVSFTRDARVNVLLDTGGNSIPDSWLCAVDAKTGQEIWQSPPIALSHFTWPVAAGDLVFVGSRAGSWQGTQYDGTGAVFAFQLRPPSPK